MVACSELPTGKDKRVTNAAERFAAQVVKCPKLPAPVRIKHRMVETVHSTEEKVAVMIFSDYEVCQGLGVSMWAPRGSASS